MVSLSIFPSWWCFMFLSSWKESFGRLHFERLNKTLIVRCQVVRDVHFSDTQPFSQYTLMARCTFSPIYCLSLMETSVVGSWRLEWLLVVLRSVLPCCFRSHWFFIHLTCSLVLLQAPWEHPYLSGWHIADSGASFCVPVASVCWHAALSQCLFDVPCAPFTWL